METWQQYEFEYLLPQWTKELLDGVNINSKNFFFNKSDTRESKKAKLTREQSIKLGNIAISLEDLGKDVLALICSHLTYHDLGSLCKVNKLWKVTYFIITTNPTDHSIRAFFVGICTIQHTESLTRKYYKHQHSYSLSKSFDQIQRCCAENLHYLY